MPGKTVHPFYSAMLPKWVLGRKSYAGSEAIKAAGTTYLPATAGQIVNGYPNLGSLGSAEYEAYKLRAVYPDIYRTAVEAAIGVMHREPATIELPSALEPMREDATCLGESLQMVLRNINTEQLITGRLGILADIKMQSNVVKPIIVQYSEVAIINWDDTSSALDSADVKLVVLDETNYEMDQSTLEWELVEKYRYLVLLNSEYKIDDTGVYSSVVLDDSDSPVFTDSKTIQPNIMGTTLDEIPFAFVNSKDISPTPDRPPLDGLADLCITIYRAEADYRQSLFMQGQDTLVRIGAQAGDDGEPVRTGAGARIDVPINGDAKYIGVSSSGLSEQRESLQNDYGRAIQKSGQLIDTTSRAKESGDALRIRVAAQTATLPQIAQAGAAGLEKVLKSLAVWYGANPDEVKVTPNLNFNAAELNAKTILELAQAKGLGAPIAWSSIHQFMKEQGFTALEYDKEKAEIEGEAPMPGANIPSPVDNEGGENGPN